MQVFRVLRESGAGSRIEVAMGRGLSPLVGREEEVYLLLRKWNQSKAGHGQLLILNGEAGIGKSRLAQSIKSHVLQEEKAARLEIRCSDYQTETPFYPLIDLLENRILGFARDDAPERKIEKLKDWMQGAGLALNPYLPVYAEFLSLPLAEELRAQYESQLLVAAGKRRKFMDGFTLALFHYSRQQPVLFVVEDLHWMDSSTLEWLTQVFGQLPAYPIFILATTRPQFHVPWPAKSHFTQLMVDRLSEDRIEAICRHQTGGKALPKALLAQIVDKTNGVPLFVEELTRMIIESDLLEEKADYFELDPAYRSDFELAIPTTLQDSLIARLDRLSHSREIAQIGAVLGREFSYELLEAVAQRPEEHLQQALSELVAGELLYPKGIGREATYLFKHALIQDTAYESLLKSRRKQLHQRVAAVLGARFPELSETQPELLAHHLERAGLLKKALEMWEKAGNISLSRFANQSAMVHFQKALGLLEQIEMPTGKEVKELDLLIPYNISVMLLKGWGHPEVELHGNRILHLCKVKSKPEKSFWGYRAITGAYLLQGKFSRSLETCNKSIQLLETLHHHFQLPWFHIVRAEINLYLGKLNLVENDIERTLGWYNQLSPPERDDLLSILVSGEIQVYTDFCMSLYLALSGFPDQALKMAVANKDYAKNRNDIVTIWRGYMSTCYTATFLRDYHKARESAETAHPILEDSGELGLLAWIQFYVYLHEDLDQEENGLSNVKGLMDAIRMSGIDFASSVCYYFLIEKHIERRNYQAGLALLQEIMDSFYDLEERIVESGLFRQKGDLLTLKDPGHPDAENWYLKAIEVAQQQKTKWFELLATKSLARLWQAQGRGPQAYDMLHGVYNWFTEGFDTFDMQEAKALLAELEKASNPSGK